MVKKTVAQLEKDNRNTGQKIQDDLNDQVRKWGIDVQKVELSTVKILKYPENGSTTAVGSILKGLGVKRDEEYQTQTDVLRASHGLSEPPRKKTESEDNENGFITPSEAEKG